MEKFYIYKLTFRNGCTYIGKHHQKKEYDSYITSSSYYEKHKDFLEKREIILEVSDIETLDIMETICILGDIAENPLNVNYNYGAWLNHSKFDRGFSGAANGMYGKKHSELTRIKMKARWTKERKEKNSKRQKKYCRTQEWKDKMNELNSSQDHIKKCNETKRKNKNIRQRYMCINDTSIVVDYNTWDELLGRDKRFVRIEDYTEVSDKKLKEWIVLNKPGHGNSAKGKHWYNNGIIETYAFECPQGFEKGRLKFSKETISNMKAASQRVLANGGNKHRTGCIPWNKGLKKGEQKDGIK